MNMYSINAISRFYLAVAFFFILFLFFALDSLFGSTSLDYSKIDTSSEIILARLSRALSELNSLKAQNEELRILLRQYMPNSLQTNNIYLKAPPLISDVLTNYKDENSQNSYQSQSNNKDSQFEPSIKYELAHRKLHNDIHELWNIVKNYSSSNILIKQLRDSLLFDLETIRERDEEWRRKKLLKLSSYVQKMFHKLQNPTDCSIARKLVCNLNKGCGLGCQLHHVVYCMIVSIATERTLILNSNSWRYISNKHNSKSLWEAAFMPLSDNCLNDSGTNPANWGPDADNAQVLHLPVIDSLRSRPDYLPLAIPEKISKRLIQLHGAPSVWFIGQILKYLLKPTLEIQNFLTERSKTFQFKHPIVGVHVRRTDKIHTEASFHPLSQYMEHVQEFYDRLQLWNQRKSINEPIEKLVYLATDDIGVWEYEISSYQKLGFKFIGDDQISNTASVQRRYSFDSLKNVILDIWMLSQTDYLVCTFSSQICRVAYELMQAHNSSEDRSSNFRSLDDIFYFGGQNAHNQVALLNHEPSRDKELKLKIGDVLGVAGNHWNGFNKGINRETQEKGLYPGFKTSDKVETAIFQLFQNDQNSDF